MKYLVISNVVVVIALLVVACKEEVSRKRIDSSENIKLSKLAKNDEACLLYTSDAADE